jgi:ribosomal protein S18 acetylase RimI-like enzyme
VVIETRPPEASDALPLALLLDRAWRSAYDSLLTERFWDSYPIAQRVSDLHRSIADPAQRGLVAEVDGSLVGWALRGPSRASTSGIEPARLSELYSLYALAPGSGLGQRLLDELLDHEPAELWVFEANVRAQRFYAQRVRPRRSASHPSARHR